MYKPLLSKVKGKIKLKGKINQYQFDAIVKKSI